MTADSPLLTDRPALMARLARTGVCDLAIVGGGATGLGLALDAALRGLSVVLLESHDYAQGTSSRATKLAHGGVRYLEQGNLKLVRAALRERASILRNAPHLSSPLRFTVPAYRWWELPWYGAGLAFYGALAGRESLGSLRIAGARRTLRRVPGLHAAGLLGAVQYWDAQFDDARLALALARSAAEAGALVLNHCAVTGLFYEQGRVAGVYCSDTESGAEHLLRARCVVNAAGVWADTLRRQDQGQGTQPMATISQGVHLVVGREFLPAHSALLVPRTRDGRVLFAVPWLGKVVLGTTDTVRGDAPREPQADEHDVAFILGEAARYLQRAPGPGDVSSVWAGLRALVRAAPGDGPSRRISREHAIEVGASGLVTVMGGKWTTYRAMAQDVLAHCEQAGLLGPLPPCRTAHHALLGAQASPRPEADLTRPPGLSAYGNEQAIVASLPGHDSWLAPGLSVAMVRFAARYEYARTTEDMLARRSRLLFLDARQAAQAAPAVARVLEQETGVDPRLEDFLDLAARYARVPGIDQPANSVRAPS